MRLCMCVCVCGCLWVFGWAAALHATLAFWHIIPLVPTPPSSAWLKAVCFAVDFRYVLVCRLVVLAAPESVLQHFLPFTFLHSQWKADVCVRGGGVGGVCGLNSPAHICAFSQCVFLFDLRSLSLTAIRSLSLIYSTAL